MIGTTLGPYQILEEIGQGGMATVYRAYQPAMDRQVAVKIIHPSIAHDQVVLERFRREARLVARLDHVHILPIYDFNGIHNPPYIVMPYMASGTLKEVIQDRSLSFAEIGAIARQVAGALDYAHRQGIVHRDIKPSNIMLDEDNNVYLTDFGTARIMFSSQDGRSRATDITQSGVVLGTPDYLAPEQATRGNEVGPAADIYALGVVLFQMLTGQLPYTGETALAVIIKHAQAPIPSVTDLKPHLPPAVNDVIARALAKKPTERYASASDLVTGLVEALSGTAGRQSDSQIVALDRAKSLIFTWPREQNKVVTVVCLDAVEYAGLIGEMKGLEAAHYAINQLWDRAKEIAGDQGGRAVSQTENTLLLLWGGEVAHEDDPEQAIRTALAIQAALRTQGEQILTTGDEALLLGIGIHTGMVLLAFTPPTSASPAGKTAGQTIASGLTLNLAGRLAGQAGGMILISHDTFRHVLGVFDVQPGGSIKLPGPKEALPVYRVIAAKAHVFRMNLRGIEGIKTKQIGRESEFEQLQQTFLAAIEDRQPRMMTVVGAAGLGKSRLLYELNAWLDLRPEGVWFFRGRATPGMTNRPYALLRDVLSYRFKLQATDTPAVLRQKLEIGLVELISTASPEMAPLIGHLAGFDFSDSPYIKGILHDPPQLAAMSQRAFSQMFVRLGEQSPIVIQLEDLHWADEASLDLFHGLASEPGPLPLLLIGAARPLLYERRPTWGNGQPFHIRLDLHPLPKQESQLLIREILQKMPEAPRLLIDLIVTQAEGNPYYIEEFIKMLIEERVIHKSKEAWTVETERLAHLPVPPTLIGLLQARLDGLLYPERVVLQRAAVVGRIFWDSAITALEAADGIEVADIGPVLQALRAREFIYRRGAITFAGSQEYSFSQGILRDVIYEGLVKRQQQAYHAGIAVWLARIAGDRAEEYTALMAEHYEKAGDGEKAAQALAQAGKRAMQVSAFKEALAFYERVLIALTLDPSPRGRGDRDEGQIPLLLKLGEVNWLLGNFPEARRRLEDGLALSRQTNNRQGITEALYLLSQVAIKQGNFAKAQQCLAESLPLARQINEPALLARVLYGTGDLIWRLGQYEEARPYVEESLQLAHQSGELAQIVEGLNRLGSIHHSLKAYHQAREHYEEGRTLALQAGNRRWLAACLNNLGVVDYYEGNYAEARDYFQEAVAIARELSQRDNEALYLLSLSDACLKLGDVSAAEQYARQALQLALTIGGLLWAVYALVIFAELRAQAGDTGGALTLLGLALHHPAADANTREEIERVLSELHLQPESVESGLRRGRVLDFETVVKELLQEDN